MWQRRVAYFLHMPRQSRLLTSSPQPQAQSGGLSEWITISSTEGGNTNLTTVSKAELVARARFTCPHRHNGVEHSACFDKFHPAERLGFLDIEATSLNASFGYMLTYCIKRHGAETIQRSITPKEIRGHKYDRRLCQDFLKDIEGFDRLVGYYSSRYDVPFLRTRCLYWSLGFPPMGSLFHTDLYYAVRNKLRLHRNRLETACELFGIPSKGHRLNPSVWQAAQTGDKAAIEFVLAHNTEDVASTEQLWDLLDGQVRKNKTSL